MTITTCYLHELFEYRNGVLIWKINTGFKKLIGKEAGYKSNDGYIQIRLNGRLEYAHRIIWWMFNGYDPYIQIDHNDCDTSNNNISNLRISTKHQNGCNRGKNKNNSSGFKGVMFYKAYKKWTAQIKVMGKSKSLGYFNTPEEASLAYQSAANKLHGEFAKTQ